MVWVAEMDSSGGRIDPLRWKRRKSSVRSGDSWTYNNRRSIDGSIPHWSYCRIFFWKRAGFRMERRSRQKELGGRDGAGAGRSRWGRNWTAEHKWRTQSAGRTIGPGAVGTAMNPSRQNPPSQRGGWPTMRVPILARWLASGPAFLSIARPGRPPTIA